VVNVRSKPLPYGRLSLAIVEYLVQEPLLLLRLLFEQQEVWQNEKDVDLIGVVVLTKKHLHVDFELLLIFGAWSGLDYVVKIEFYQLERYDLLLIQRLLLLEFLNGIVLPDLFA
jgi:hypothetical protein